MSNIVASIGRGHLEVLGERLEAIGHKFKCYEEVFRLVKDFFKPE